jgi:YVTN family beta-propeller protein
VIRMSSRVSVERVGDDLMVLTHDGVVHKVTGPAAHVLDCVAEGRPVPDGLDDAVAALVDAGVLDNPGGVSRRLVLVGSGAAAAVGLTSLVLPMASAAASPAPSAPDFSASSTTLTLDLNPIMFTSDGVYLYIATYSGAVWRIDPLTNSATRLISGLTNTWMATPSSGGTKLYVTENVDISEAFGRVRVVSTSGATANTVVGTINVGRLPGSAFLNADGSRLFVLISSGAANQPGNQISVIDTDSDTLVNTITSGPSPNVFDRPYGAVRAGSRLYVTNSGQTVGTTVSMVNMASNAIDATITVGSVPRDPAITPDGTRIYVPNQSSGTVSVIDSNPASGTYNTVIATLPSLASAVSVAISPDGRRGFVSLTASNEVKVINTDPTSGTYHQVLQTLTTGSTPRGMAVWNIGAGQLRLFVANSGSNTVSVFTTPTP